MKVKLKKINLDYVSVLKYLFIYIGFILLNCLEREAYPYSTALFIACMVTGSSPFILPLLYFASFLTVGKPSLLLSALVPAVIFFAVVLIYKKCKVKPKFELIFFTIISTLGYVLIGDTKVEVEMERRIIVSLIVVALTFLSILAINAISKKGLRFKLGFEEYLSIAIMTCAIGLGTCNLISPILWKGLSALILLLVCYLYRAGTGSLISAVLGISLALHYGEINYVAVFLVWNIACSTFNMLSRYLSAVALICCDFFAQVIFDIYGGYGLAEFLPMAIAGVIFTVIPTKPLLKLKEKLYSFREKQLVRESINRNRLMLSNKLYELSGVFSEMAGAIGAFKRSNLTDEGAREGIQNQIISTVCKNCENYINCKKNERSLAFNLGKMTDIGFAKGKLSFIDLNKEVLSLCVHPNDVLFAMNKLLAEYRSYKIENANLISGRDMLAEEAVGVSEILKALALETGGLLKYQSRLERKLADALLKSGFNVSELLIYGEEDAISVSLILTMQEFSLNKLQTIINRCTGIALSLKDKSDVSEDKCYLSFSKCADYDAVFGISKATKDGSPLSGDTHSVIRISDNKFLLALSDGMGSGKNAESISSASLSLIESFYKAGLNSRLILSTVNKLLAINTEDSFTALDVSVIDLNDCSADFIKYGSPYGFIVSDNGVRIIEGNSLPLGIIEELKPSVANAMLNDGDVVVLVTDGISDAFGSSGEVIDFLRSVPAKNPQTLADKLLAHAVYLSNGEHKDDMTVLAVRIFKRKLLA